VSFIKYQSYFLELMLEYISVILQLINFANIKVINNDSNLFINYIYIYIAQFFKLFLLNIKIRNYLFNMAQNYIFRNNIISFLLY